MSQEGSGKTSPAVGRLSESERTLPQVRLQVAPTRWGSRVHSGDSRQATKAGDASRDAETQTLVEQTGASGAGGPGLFLSWPFHDLGHLLRQVGSPPSAWAPHHPPSFWSRDHRTEGLRERPRKHRNRKGGVSLCPCVHVSVSLYLCLSASVCPRVPVCVSLSVSLCV